VTGNRAANSSTVWHGCGGPTRRIAEHLCACVAQLGSIAAFAFYPRGQRSPPMRLTSVWRPQYAPSSVQRLPAQCGVEADEARIQTCDVTSSAQAARESTRRWPGFQFGEGIGRFSISTIADLCRRRQSRTLLTYCSTGERPVAGPGHNLGCGMPVRGGAGSIRGIRSLRQRAQRALRKPRVTSNVDHRVQSAARFRVIARSLMAGFGAEPGGQASRIATRNADLYRTPVSSAFACCIARSPAITRAAFRDSRVFISFERDHSSG